MKGKYYFLVGDSAAGKTFFSMTCFAEACRSKLFKDYRLIYDNVEDGMLMDVEHLFGERAAARIEAPAEDEDGTPTYSETIEEFYYNIDDAIDADVPFIYVLDSMDGLSSSYEGSKFDEQKDAYRKGKKAKGSFGDGKAKQNSANLRKCLKGIRELDSILIIVAQTRDMLNAGPFQSSKTRSGGRALRFYATVEIWLSLVGQLKKTVKGKSRKIGNKIKLQIKKNRVTGLLHEVITAIYPSYGVDDIGSCIDYLIEEGRWKKKGQKIKANSLFDEVLTKDALIKKIEGKKKLTRKLRRLVGQVWYEVEEACSLNRRRRY